MDSVTALNLLITCSFDKLEFGVYVSVSVEIVFPLFNLIVAFA